MSNPYEQEKLPEGVPPITLAPKAPRLLRPPFWAISILLIVLIGSWVPLVFFARARTSKTPNPRVHLVQDMGSQPKYREQQSSEIFADSRADRGHVPGTVARGGAQLDDHQYRGYEMVTTNGKTAPRFFEGYPKDVKVNDALLRRGQERFNIYCSACHGIDGYGRGPVAVRADELGNSINAASLHSDLVRSRSEGHLFNTISVGIRNMPPYGAQIPVNDRWAIVAYVRALQFSQAAPVNAVPQEKRSELK